MRGGGRRRRGGRRGCDNTGRRVARLTSFCIWSDNICQLLTVALRQMRWFTIVSFLLLARSAWADQLYVVVSVKCTQKHIEVKFERAWDESGASILAAGIPNRWNVKELRTITSSDGVKYNTTPHPKTVLCQLSGVPIRVTVHPFFAPRWHPVGYCAARTGARVDIYRGGSLLFTDGLDACTEVGEVPTSITVSTIGPPTVARIPAEKFIQGP